MQHATCMRQYHLPYLMRKKEENINDETVQNWNVNTFIQTSCLLFNMRNNINAEQKIRLCQLTSESQQNEHTSSGIWLLLLFWLNVNSIQNRTKLLCIIKAF